MVMGAQKVLGFTGKNLDGFHGPMTNKVLKQYQSDEGLEVTGIFDKKTLRYMKVDLCYRVFNLVAQFEGALSKANAWGYKSIVPGDGAGWNYGILQHNRLGSMQLLKRQFGNIDGAWFRTPAGSRGQFWYFMKYIFNPSVENANLMGDESERTICMLCDARTQGGGFFPSKKPKSFADWKLDPEWVDIANRLYSEHSVKSAFLSMVLRHSCPGKMFAELYPRSGNPKYLADQLSRRRTVIYGHGVVHGSVIKMEDFLL